MKNIFKALNLKHFCTAAIIFILCFTISGCGEIISDSYFSSPDGKITNEHTSFSNDSVSSESAEGYVNIHAIDVGQGLGIIVESVDSRRQHHYMLIDGGPADHTSNLISYMQKNNIDSIESIFVTHFHADHINGSYAVLTKYGAENIYQPGYTVSDRSIYKKWMKLIAGRNVFTDPPCGYSFSLGDATVTVLSAENNNSYDENNRSIGVRVTYGDTSCICLGDLEMEGEYDLCDIAESRGVDLDAQLYIAGHHGSYSSSSERLLKAMGQNIDQHLCVISCGMGNPYGHPHGDTLSRLAEADYEIWRTDRQGDIVFTLDGSSISSQTSACNDFTPSK